MIAVIYVASILFKDGRISIGEISSFMFYMIMLVMNFTILGMVFGNIGSVVGASDKIYEFMTHEPTIKTNDEEIQKYSRVNGTEGKKYIKIEGEVNGRIELKNIKFTYPSKKHEGNQVLKGVSLSVDNDKNRVVALCGTSGCGKSSIIALMERFYDADEGEVLFNGVNVQDLDPKWYHS
jgi:ABC-type multidrug transport system fused ATPase/permease subunit